MTQFPSSIAKTNPMPYGFTVIDGSGPYLNTVEHGQMIDLTSGIAVNNCGHSNGRVIQAITEQVEKHSHVMVYGELIQKSQTDYADELTRVLGRKLDGSPALSKIWFTNSGAESTDTALKLAHLARPNRKGYIAIKGGFHGRSIGSLGVTYREKYRLPFTDLYPENYCTWIEEGEKIPNSLRNSKALILELIRGEDGVRPCSREFTEYVYDWCCNNDVLLIVDEVQTGFGRTGEMFALDHYPWVKPDMITLGKAMGGGLPLGGVVASSELFDEFETKHPFTHLSTFGGNPVSCAAGLASYRLIEESLCRNARERESQIREIFGVWNEITDIRGKGLMLGIEFESPELATQFVTTSWEAGLWVGFVLHDERTIRIYPTLDIDDDDVKRISEKVVEVMYDIGCSF